MKKGIQIGLSMLLLMAGSLLTSASYFPIEGGLKVGDTAPDFALKSVSGKTISLKDLKNAQGYIVAFTCNTCPYAQMYEDRLIELHKKMAPLGWPVVAINANDPSVTPGDSFVKMKERSDEKKYPFEYLFDEGQKVFPVYGAVRTPHIFLLDKDLKVRYIGAIDDNAEDPTSITNRYVENAIDAINKGKDPNPNFTKAIGCTIKVKK
jgi:peroxiredoxin